jgi:hypothetical protein
MKVRYTAGEVIAGGDEAGSNIAECSSMRQGMARHAAAQQHVTRAANGQACQCQPYTPPLPHKTTMPPATVPTPLRHPPNSRRWVPCAVCACEDGGQVKPEAIHVVLIHPVAQAVHDQLAHSGVVAVERVATATAGHSTAQHSRSQHSKGQHSKGQHSVATCCFSMKAERHPLPCDCRTPQNI